MPVDGSSTLGTISDLNARLAKMRVSVYSELMYDTFLLAYGQWYGKRFTQRKSSSNDTIFRKSPGMIAAQNSALSQYSEIGRAIMVVPITVGMP